MHTFGFGAMPMLFAWFFWAIVIAGIVFLIVKLAGGSTGSSEGRREQRETAEEILKQRYARGEITKDQYEDMLRTLRQ